MIKEAKFPEENVEEVVDATKGNRIKVEATFMVSTDIMVTMTPVTMMFRAQRAIHKVLCLGFACKIYAIKFINTKMLYINSFYFYLVFQFLNHLF